MTPEIKFEIDVLIIGSGPAGSSASALLSMYGIKKRGDHEIQLVG